MKALQVDILKRFMSDENFNFLLQEYKAARILQRREKEVSHSDQILHKEFVGGMSVPDIAKKYGISETRVTKSIVVASKYINPNY